MTMAAAVGGPVLRMLTGKPMPLIGLGTWQSLAGEVEKAVTVALDVGYRHIDTARGYDNEGEIGNALEKAIQDSKVTREDVFITTKLTGAAAHPNRVRQQTETSLKLLKTSYIDLLLIHFPVIYSEVGMDKQPPQLFPTDADGKRLVVANEPLDTYKEMEKLVDEGLVKAIGLSNFNKNQVQRIWENCKVKPSNLQCECHAWFPQDDLVNYCKEKGITFAAYGPIGSPGRPGADGDRPVLMEDPVIIRIAKDHGITPAQVLLKYLLQRDIIVLPKSSNEGRIKANYELFSFSLSEKDMGDIKAINKEERLFKFNHAGPTVSEHPQFPW